MRPFVPTMIALSIFTVAACSEDATSAREDEAQACRETRAVAADARPATVSFRKDVAPVMAASCSFRSCHGLSGRGLHLSKDPAELYAELLGKSSETRTSARYVVPNDPEASWLLAKLTGELCDPACANGACGARMPKGGDPLPPASIAAIEKWIADGAKND